MAKVINNHNLINPISDKIQTHLAMNSIKTKAFSEDYARNPDKYQHIGGGPGMFVEPGQSYDDYKQSVIQGYKNTTAQ